MSILWYFLTFVLGGFGILALLRFIERLSIGAGFLPVQIGIALFFLFLAWQCLRKARAKTPLQRQ